MKSRVIVTVIIKRGDSYLMGMKPKDVGPYPNTWHHLGGGTNLEDETLEEAARREIREEAGIELGELTKASFDEDYEKDKHGELTHYLFLRFKGEYKSGELKASDDIEKLSWIKEKDLKNVPLTRPSAKLFREEGLI